VANKTHALGQELKKDLLITTYKIVTNAAQKSVITNIVLKQTLSIKTVPNLEGTFVMRATNVSSIPLNL
jgi:hypothetical protein